MPLALPPPPFPFLQFDAMVKDQWRTLQTAKERSLKGYLYKLARFILSREDPIESFLKSIPKVGEEQGCGYSIWARK
jgi:hypothetical protein